MKKNIIIFIILISIHGFAQKGIFDIARTGTLDELKELMKSNPNVINEADKNGFTPLILACYRGNNPVAKFLVNNVKNIDEPCDMGTALMACTVKGNVEISKLLLEKGSNPNITDSNGTTSLMYAVQFKNLELVKTLLQHKADKTKMDNKGKTAFEYAVFSGNEEIINLIKN